MIKKFYYPKDFLIQTLPNPNSTYGSALGGGRYKSGASVQISATPNTGYAFLQWREGETTTNPRTITVLGNATYNALFYKLLNGVLRIVDSSLNLYTYSEYANLQSPPAAIGVAINDGEDWIVYYKQYIGVSGEGITGYKLASDKGSLPKDGTFVPLLSSELLYTHSGLSASLVYKNYAKSGYAAYYADALTDGGLTWYIPNLYELTQIFGKAFDTSEGAHDSFNSHFILSNGDQIQLNSDSGGHAHWTSDIGFGNSATQGDILPYRVYLRGNSSFQYASSGNHTYPGNHNYVRPVARFSADEVNITYNDNGADSGSAPSNSTIYKGDLATIATNSGNLSKTGYTFNGWNTAADGSGTHYNVGIALHLHADLILYVEWT